MTDLTPRQAEIVAAVKRRRGNQSAAARDLGISKGSIGFVVRKFEQLTGTNLPRGKAGRRPGSTSFPVAKKPEPAPKLHTIERVRFKAGTVSGQAPIRCECGWSGVVDDWNAHHRKPAA